ncbi:MAG: hypothetical protein AAGK22_05585 [Acidobacteriota bacterium]
MKPRSWAAGILSCFVLVSCADTPFRETVGTRLLMASVFDPTADRIWNAVRTEMTLEGTTEFRPETDEEWNAVRNAAVTLAESGNLLMIGSRVRDQNDWIAWSRDLISAGEMAMRAAEAQDPERLFEVGAEIYRACDGCHSQYWVGQFQPDDGRAVVEAGERFDREENE